MELSIIGAGNWGINLVRNFSKILGLNSVSVCDLDENRLTLVKSEYAGIKTYRKPGEIIDISQIKAVVISTPAETHYEIAKKALLAGKHVFVEKPLSLEIKEAEELIEIAEKNKLTLMVDHLLVYHPVVCEIKKLIDNGELGSIYYFYSQRLNLGVIRSKENVLWSLGPHDISVFLYLLNDSPVRIEASGGIYVQETQKIEDAVFLHLNFSSGVDAHAHLSWLDPHKVRRLTVVGDKKMIVFDDMEPRNKLAIFDKGVEWTEKGGISVRYGDICLPSIRLYEPLKAACEHFIHCIEQGKRPKSDGNSGLEVLKVLKKAQESLEKNK
ncbi:Gfo/Idh/MocA family oxidoreductase [candidate division WOR-3 bacterium]|nr:Gfo/Idh/MocA family oxidoreductase [candidate division WOR-3 bacterium]